MIISQLLLIWFWWRDMVPRDNITRDNPARETICPGDNPPRRQPATETTCPETICLQDNMPPRQCAPETTRPGDNMPHETKQLSRDVNELARKPIVSAPVNCKEVVKYYTIMDFTFRIIWVLAFNYAYILRNQQKIILIFCERLLYQNESQLTLIKMKVIYPIPKHK